MQTVSDELLAAIRSSQVLAVEATASSPTGEVVDLPVKGGAVTIDRAADHRRRLDLTLAAKYPAGHTREGQDVYPATPASPVNVFGSEVMVWRGVRHTSAEVVLLGVFRVETITADTPGGSVIVEAWDRSRQVADRRFLKPRKFLSQPALDLIRLLVSEVYPSVVFDVQTADTTTLPKHVIERDRWAEVQRVAKVIGCEAYFNADGSFRIQDVPDLATSLPVWDVDEGETGVLVSGTGSVSREGAPNIVAALGESPNGNNDPVYGIARDTNPASPTYYLGAYGQVPRFYSSPMIRTQAQADKVAASMLADHIGVSRSVSFNAVPNPALEAGDVVRIRFPGKPPESHILDQVTIPLSTTEPMTGETRAADWVAD